MPAKLNDTDNVWVIEMHTDEPGAVVFDPRLIVKLPEGLQIDFTFVLGTNEAGAAVLMGQLDIWRGKTTKTDEIDIAQQLRAPKKQAIEYAHFGMFKASQAVPLKELARVLIKEPGPWTPDAVNRLFVNHALKGFFFLHTLQVKVMLPRLVGGLDDLLITVECERNGQVMHDFTFRLPWEKAQAAFDRKSLFDVAV